jgi:hypothetical protein
MHHDYEKWTRSQLVKLAFIFSVEALVIEALADLASKPILGNYIFYYEPGNLGHVTAVQNVPFYFLTGFLVVETIHWFKTSPQYFTFISSWVTLITIFFR